MMTATATATAVNDDALVNDNALKSVDVFYKDCHLMFKDIVECITQENKSFSLKEDRDEHKLDAGTSRTGRHFIFQIPSKENRIYFALMLIKMEAELFNKVYEDICKHLEIDSEFPRLIVTGFIGTDDNPIDYQGYNDRDKAKLRRLWIYCTLQVSQGGWGNQFKNNLPDFSSTDYPYELKSSDYKFRTQLNLKIKPGITGIQWCKNATFKIRRLPDDIENGKNVEDIVKELLSM